MKVRIVSDGTARGTQVLDLEGRVIQGVTAVGWHVDGRRRMDCARATIEVDLVSLDVVGDVGGGVVDPSASEAEQICTLLEQAQKK